MSMSSGRSHNAELFLPLFLLVSLLGWVVVRRDARSVDVFHWLPTGEAPTDLRRKWTPLDVGKRNLLPRARRPRLRYEPIDEASGSQVGRRCVAVGGREVETDQASDVLVLSSDTRREWLEHLLHSAPGRLVCIVATTIRVPADVRSIAQYQWVDFRDRSDEKLDAGSLARPPSPNTGSTSLVPESLEKAVRPAGCVAVLGNSVVPRCFQPSRLPALSFSPSRVDFARWQRSHAPPRTPGPTGWRNVPVARGENADATNQQEEISYTLLWYSGRDDLVGDGHRNPAISSRI